ncbi:hypothetical protein MMG94_02015 [Methylocystis parvus OBBP]|uniref:Uncharacterized protein n=2 Tax=Methylocystis parvus TaxID=134 RepID=A0A6B8M950_9HYPH|nr:hypothetical protein [Methylocystis parvus]QGM99108.1 hypothetical protein F7D14_17525 [Methylocystis parvus]WBK00522.1 hypothetical protein MMG94_02015 [Methylocystis parvus OBBP]
MKIPSAKGDLEALRQMGEAFGVLPGVERVTINADTGSIVLHYDHEDDRFHDHLHRSVHGVNGSRPPETELDQLVHKIEDEAKFLAEHSHTARLIVGLFSDLDREIRKSTNNNADLKLALAASVVGVTVLEIGMTAATPVWLTLSVFTLNHFVELHQPRRQPASARAPMAFKKAR